MKFLKRTTLALLFVFMMGINSVGTLCVSASENTVENDDVNTENTEAADEENAEAKEDNRTIPDYISIAGVDVSGKTKQEAEEVVSDFLKKYDDVEFKLFVGENSVTADRKEIGLCAKNDDVIERALSYGQDGNLLYRYKAKKDLKNGKTKDFAISLTSDTATVEDFLNQHKEDLVVEAVDNTVKLVDGEFAYVPGKTGEALLVGKSAVAIGDYISTDWDGKNASIELLTQKDEPRGTKEELSAIKDMLGTFNTNFGTAVDGRTKNITVAAGKLNGMVVYPGEVVSVSEAIGPTTEENGYFLAGSYENGTTVETYGGGICQVSTTLYNAVIRAELEVVNRSAHSMIVGYVEPSMDAAIADGIKDFQFKNNQETPVYIDGYTSGGNLYFSIYGKEVRPANRRVEFVSEVTSQTDPEKEFVAVGDQPIGYMETTVKPHIGYTARLWKIVYENDVEVDRKIFNNSKYNPSKEVISVGVATGSPEAQNAVLTAVATQDENQIAAAVASWNDAAIAARAQQEMQKNSTKPTNTKPEDSKKENKEDAENTDDKEEGSENTAE